VATDDVARCDVAATWPAAAPARPDAEHRAAPVQRIAEEN
jgi:hypothetical protein